MSRVFVSGIGAVSPAGWGVPALQASLQNAQPLPVQSLPRPGWPDPLPARLVPPPAGRPAFLAHPRLRRASPITHYSVAAALEALGGDADLITRGELRLGILTCTMTGGISYSRRFYQEVLHDPATASPMVFPETVFNAAASHLAALLNCRGVNNTIVGDPGTFLQALAVAAGWLEDSSAEACLVIGAEEPDWTAADALRLFDKKAVYASGAGALYLKKDQSGAPAVELAAVTDSCAMTGRSDRAAAAQMVRAQLPPAAPGDLLCPSEPAARAWMDWTGQVLAPAEVLGEAFVASSAWQCVAAADAIRHRTHPGVSITVSGPGRQTIGARFVAASSSHPVQSSQIT